MRYASIRGLDVSNGEGVGISLFVQGCDFHCSGCFNSETWDFNGGNEWTSESKEKVLKLLNRPFIQRITILGGEPLAEQNIADVLNLVEEIRVSFPDKSIWLYTGYTYEECLIQTMRSRIIENVDVVVDGRYIEALKDLTLPWRGSSNQRVINVKESLKKGEIILWDS